MKHLFILLLFTTSNFFAQSLKDEIAIIDTVFIKHSFSKNEVLFSKSQVLQLFEPDLFINNEFRTAIKGN